MKTADEALSDNLKWVTANTRLNSQAKLGAAASVDQRTIGRVMNREHSPTVDKLDALAKALKIEAWQLLVPRFGAGLYQMDADMRMVPVRVPAADAKPGARGKAAPLDLGEAKAVFSANAAPAPAKRTADAQGRAEPSAPGVRAPKP